VNPSSNSPEPSDPQDEQSLTRARLAPRFAYSWIWLTPLAALALVGYLVYSFVANRGPLIAITFDNADGLSAGQTQVKYKAVTLGTVANIELTDDLSHVIVKVRMTDRAESMLTPDTRFWVVRPRLGGGIRALQAGLETLVSGAYIAIDPGSTQSTGKPATYFEGLEEPPSVRSDEPGTVYFLEAESLGGLDAGAPIFCRDVEVGRVLSHQLEKFQKDVRIRIFVRAPYDEWVVPETQFWNASGLHVGTGADGLEIQIQSLQSLFSGSIAFRTATDVKSDARSPPETTFRLYRDRATADSGLYSLSIPYVSYFQTSIRGLTEGSEVHMFGKRLGSVTNVELLRDPRPEHEGNMVVRVAYVLQPERGLRERDRSALRAEGMRSLVENRLRVVLETNNFVTGQKVLALRYVPGARAGSVTREGDALVLPSETEGLEELTASAAQIANEINRIPFREIGANLNRTLASVERAVAGPELENAITSLSATLADVQGLVQQAQVGLTPALERLPGISERLEHAVEQADTALGQSGYGTDSTAQHNLERMMDQVADAARSIRLLADYLTRHPESVLSGRKAESK
jgi:paraquat-inducible protein B